MRRAAPISLATTLGISVDFYSSAYLDVSVQQVRLTLLINSGEDDPCGSGFPIRTSPDQSLFAGSSRLIASCYVLHRL